MTATQKQAVEQAMSKIKDTNGVLKNNKMIKAFAAQRTTINKEAAQKDPLIKEYINIYKELETNKDTHIGRMTNEMKTIAAQQEVYQMAATFCKDDADKQALLDEANKLNDHPAMVAYGKYLKGLEYFAGMEETLDEDIKDFYGQELHIGLELTTELDEWRTKEEEPEIEDDPEIERENQVNKEFRKLMAPAKAREIFLKHSFSSFTDIAKQFVGNQVITEKGIFTGRMTATAFMVGRMLLNGWPLEKVLDERELKDKKQKIGEEYLKHRDAQDNEWYANEMYKGGEAMIAALKKYAIEHKETIKTEKDLVSHSHTLGMLAMLCFDTQQELHRVKGYGSKEFKTLEEFSALEEKIGLFSFAAGTGSAQKLPYQIDHCDQIYTIFEMNRQLNIKNFLDELKKEEPDLDSILATFDDFSDVDKQIGTLEEFRTVFTSIDEKKPNSPDRKIDAQTINSKKLKTLASMFSLEYYEKNDIKIHSTKVPVTLTAEKPTFSVNESYVKGDTTRKVVTRGGKQLMETDIPHRYFNDLVKKDLWGKAKDNSSEFNTLIKSYRETLQKLDSSATSKKDCLDEMKHLREAAAEYIKAKRAQKGYDSKEVPDATIDAQMLGKAKGGASIFTSRGKDRYEFALNLIERMTTLENKFNSGEIQKTEKQNTENQKVENQVKAQTNEPNEIQEELDTFTRN